MAETWIPWKQVLSQALVKKRKKNNQVPKSLGFSSPAWSYTTTSEPHWRLWAGRSLSDHRQGGTQGLESLKVKVEVTSSCPTLWPRGTLQARTLEWVAIPFSRGSSQPRDWTWVAFQRHKGTRSSLEGPSSNSKISCIFWGFSKQNTADTQKL